MHARHKWVLLFGAQANALSRHRSLCNDTAPALYHRSNTVICLLFASMLPMHIKMRAAP